MRNLWFHIRRLWYWKDRLATWYLSRELKKKGEIWVYWSGGLVETLRDGIKCGDTAKQMADRCMYALFEVPSGRGGPRNNTDE